MKDEAERTGMDKRARQVEGAVRREGARRTRVEGGGECGVWRYRSKGGRRGRGAKGGRGQGKCEGQEVGAEEEGGEGADAEKSGAKRGKVETWVHGQWRPRRTGGRRTGAVRSRGRMGRQQAGDVLMERRIRHLNQRFLARCGHQQAAGVLL